MHSLCVVLTDRYCGDNDTIVIIIIMMMRLFCVFNIRIIQKIDRKTAIAVEETLIDALSAYGLAVFVLSGQCLADRILLTVEL